MQVELTVALETDSSNYDSSKGEQIALNVDGTDARAKADPDSLLYPSGYMDKQTLTSTRSVSDPARYAVGILGGRELHVTSLASILTLRPDLRYLDKSDKTARAEGRLLPTDNPDDPPPPAAAAGGDSGAEDLKQVTVRFAKGDPDFAKRMREK